MIQKTPLVPLSPLTKASRVRVDTPGKAPDPAGIRYGGGAPKSERSAPTASPPEPTPAPPIPSPPIPSPAPAATSPATAAAAATHAPILPLALPPVSQTRAALGNGPPPSRRSLVARYDLFPHGPGLLPDPGPPTGPEHWGLNHPPPGGPVLALVGQYGPSPRRGTAPLLSVSFACNFGLREPDWGEVGGPSSPGGPSGLGGPFSVGVMLPTGAAPFRPDLGQLIGFALREAAVSPRRFRPGTPGAAPDTLTPHMLTPHMLTPHMLTLLLYFVEPGGEPLRGLFGPPLPRRPLPARLIVRVPDLAGGSHRVAAEAYDAGRLPRTRSLADTQCFLAIDRGQGAAGEMGLVADLVADPAVLLSRDPERYGRAAAQMARLLILGRRPYRLPAPP